MNIVIENLIKQSVEKLTFVHIETSAYEVRLLLAAALGCDLAEVMSYKHPLSDEQLQKFAHFLELRSQHMPVDKIIGTRGFYKYDFAVDQNVLSPRSDTEILAEAAIADIKQSGCRRVLELGVGSGCIILSLLADCPWLQGVGVDISSSALEVAGKNACSLGVSGRVILQQADWFSPDFADKFAIPFDIIVSNPPYIAAAEIAGLDSEVRDYDPRFALDGGDDGLDSYRRIAELSPSLLSQGGRIYLEVGDGQDADVAAMFVAQGLTLVAVLDDYSGIKRCVILKK